MAINSSSEKINVGILGATGIVGQQLLHLLEGHPWFEVTFLAASDSSAGKPYREAVSEKWHLSQPPSQRHATLHCHRLDEIDEAKKKCRLFFSALSTEAAALYDERYAQEGMLVISHASCHRGKPHIPMIIPEINPEHLRLLIPKKGGIIAKPNCSIQSIMIPLHPLHKSFNIKKIHLTTLQSISGAGIPGISSMHITENVIPYIAGEEEKTEGEPLKIWGEMHNHTIQPATGIALSAQCTRVPVLEGHMACVSVSFEKKPTISEIMTLWNGFEGLSLPSAPRKPIHYLEEKDRPQPRLDRMREKGMAICVGRLRPCPLFDYKFVSLSHNTIRGAGGGSLLVAELLYSKGLL